MAAPVVDSVYFSGGSLEVAAHGGSGTLAYLVSCNRGKLTPVPWRKATNAVGANANRLWSWSDAISDGGWPGQGEGPPLLIEARVIDKDGRYGFATTRANIPYTSPLTVYNADPALDWTGATDITSGLQTDLGLCPDHRVYQLPPNAQGRINGTINLDLRNDLTIDLNGGHLYPGTVGAVRRDQLQLWRGTAMVVRNGTIEGSYGNAGTVPNLGGFYSTQVQYGIQAMGNNSFWFDNIEFRWITGDCFTVNSYQDDVTPHAKYGTATSCRNTTHVDRQGISIIAVLNSMWVVDMTIKDTNLTTIDLEQDSATQTIQGVRIINFTPGNNAAGSFVSLGGPGPCTDIIVAHARRYSGTNSRCQVDCNSNGTKTGLWLYDLVTTNAWAGPGGSAGNWHKVKDGFVQSVSMPGSGGPAMVLSSQCSHIRFMDSAFTGATAVYSDDGTGKDIDPDGSTT